MGHQARRRRHQKAVRLALAVQRHQDEMGGKRTMFDADGNLQEAAFPPVKFPATPDGIRAVWHAAASGGWWHHATNDPLPRT